MALSREDIAAAGFFGFVASLLILYGVVPLGGRLSFFGVSEAFWLATGTWLAMYTHCGGYDWNDSESYHKAAFAVSWIVLFAVAANSYGLLEVSIRSQVASFPYGTWVIIAVHTASAYLVWTGGE